MGFALEVVLKATIGLALAGLVSGLLFRSSASLRHLVWLIGILCVMVLPAAMWLMPVWTPQAVVTLSPEVSPGIVIDVVARAGASLPSLAQVLGFSWLAGCALLLARLVASHWEAGRLAASAVRFRTAKRVLVSDRISIPMICGLFRPVILLPDSARDWPRERLRVVLAHESMHILRRDLLWQTLAGIACALYWFHPLVWWAAARLRMECEQACDDGVLAQGERASDYAGHLVEIVRGITAEPRMTQGVIAMARISELEHRLRAMFTPDRNRGGAGRRLMALTTITALAILIPLAAVHAPAQSGSATLAGVVRDGSGAPVPKASVTLFVLGSDRREFTSTNDIGEFSFNPIADGRYKVVVKKPGFAALVMDGVTVSAAKPERLSITLAIGKVEETLTVMGERSPAPAPRPGEEIKRITVGGSVQQTKMIRQTRPAYPPDCKAQGVEGSVLLRAVISKTGEPLKLEPLNQLVDKRLIEAATEAVRQWAWEPTRLNGEPVEVITEIMINFTLAK